MQSKSPIQPLDPIIQIAGRRSFQYLTNNFYGTGQDSFTKPFAQNQEFFQLLQNIMPVAEGTFRLRYGYQLLLNLNLQQLYMPLVWSAYSFAGTGVIERIYSYQNELESLRKLVYVSPDAFIMSGEDGSSPIEILASAVPTPRAVLSRDYLYAPATTTMTTWPSGQQSDGQKWHSSKGSSILGVPRPPSTIQVTSTASAGNITLVSTIGRVYAGAYLNSSTGEYSDTDTSLGAFASGSGGPAATTVVTQDSSGTTWTNLNNVKVEDGTTSNTVLGALNLSNIITATGFGFAIPAAGTITGVQVAIKRAHSSALSVVDEVVRLVKGGVTAGDNNADTVTPWPSTLTSANYGGSNNLWGLTLTPADVNAANFGVSIQVFEPTDTDLVITATAKIDFIAITIYYATTNGVKTGAIAGKQVSLSLPTSNPPAGVDKFVIMATLDGGNVTTLYIVDTVPIATTTYIDNIPDNVLVTNNIAGEVDDTGIRHGLLENEFPVLGIKFPIKHRGRIYGAVNETLYFSKSLDEITTSTGLVLGRFESAWPPLSSIDISTQKETIRGMLSDGTTLYTGTERHIWRLDGDGPLNFSKPEIVFNEVGILNQEVWQTCFAEGMPVGMIWLTPDSRVVMSNFAQYQDIGTPIQDVLNSINASATNGAWAQFYSRQEFDIYILALPTGSANSPNVFLIYDLRGGKWYKWAAADNFTAGLYNIDNNGTPQWLMAADTNKIYNFLPTVTQDRVGDTPVAITATIKTPWLHFGRPTDRKSWDELEVITNDAALTVSVDGASTMAQTASPNSITSTSALTVSPFGYFKLYLAGKASRDKHYQLTFTSNSGVQDILQGYTATLLPFRGF